MVVIFLSGEWTCLLVFLNFRMENNFWDFLFPSLSTNPLNIESTLKGNNLLQWAGG